MTILSEKYEIQYQSPNTHRNYFWGVDSSCPKVTSLGEGLATLKYNQDIHEWKQIGCKFRLVKITEEVVSKDE